MLRKSWILGLVGGLGLFAQAPAAQANDMFAANDTMPVNWGGHLFGRGCSTCGSGYYAPYYGGYGYYGASTYGYGYAPQSYWGGGWGSSYGAYPAPSGYWGASAAPAGYWCGYAASYGYGWGHAGNYGYGVGYPSYGYGWGYPVSYGYGYGYYQPYATGYYAVPSYTPCCASSYYQPAATWAVPFAYATPPVANFYATTARVAVAYPQAVPYTVAPPVGPSAAPYPAVVPQAQGFEYDGGPNRPVPMPRLEPQPAPAGGPGMFNIRLTDNNQAPASKYAYKAYGEKSATPTISRDNTVLVKDGSSR